MKHPPSTPHTGSGFRRAAAWLLWIALLVLTGIAALFSRRIPVKGAFLVCLLVPGISLLNNRLVRKKLSAGITLPLSAAKGRPAEGCITLRNEGFPASGKVSVILSVTNVLTGENTKQLLLLSAPSRGSSSTHFILSSVHCGTIECVAEDMVLYDWFGLFRQRVFLQASGSLLILPDTFPVDIQESAFLTEAYSPEEQDSIRGTEDPAEIRSLREYRAGDPVRQIHWKLSAKRGVPVLKEISRPVSRTLLLFWDKVHGADPRATDALAEAVCSLALSLARRQIPFAFGWRGRNGTEIKVITDEDAAIQAVSLVLRYGPDPGCSDPSGSLEPVKEAERYARTLWFSVVYPFESMAFLSAESIVYLCGETLPDRGSLLTVFFTPDESREMLRILRL